jgi:hypothetical protein
MNKQQKRQKEASYLNTLPTVKEDESNMNIQSTGGNGKSSAKTLFQFHSVHYTSHKDLSGTELGPPPHRPATNRLKHGTAKNIVPPLGIELHFLGYSLHSLVALPTVLSLHGISIYYASTFYERQTASNSTEQSPS